MAKMKKGRVKQYIWMKWYLGGCVSVLVLVQQLWGVNTKQARTIILDVSRRLTGAYCRERDDRSRR